ncbi:MAG: hypothetical protein HUU46_06410 [Candidatus Hydrogenedentes bacterium]|nr:hypothetical protein [Candidatus Hydrogenedentota bacterium]
MMDTYSPFLALLQNWGWALIHSIWQLAILGGLAALLLTLVKRERAGLRHGILFAVLILMAASPAVTFLSLTPANAFSDVWASFVAPQGSTISSTKSSRNVNDSANSPCPECEESLTTDTSAASVETGVDATALAWPVPDAYRRAIRACEPMLPWLVLIWALGASVCVLRLAMGSVWVLRITTTQTARYCAELMQTTDRIRKELGVSYPVRVAISLLVEVPTVLGWLRPLILIPPSAITGLTPQQLEMIIAHELAHLARRDQFIILIQSFVEAVYFYHPAVWWVSKMLREEREHCCDDCVSRLFHNNDVYVRALLLLAETHRKEPAYALGATGGSLYRRVRRLLAGSNSASKAERIYGGMLPLGLLALLIAACATTPFLRGPAEAAPGLKVLTFLRPAGVLCQRPQGTTTFFDWVETVPAAGTIQVPAEYDFALMMRPDAQFDLASLASAPSDDISALLLGSFYVYRAGNEPPERAYADALQTEKRTRMPLYDDHVKHMVHFTGLRELYLDHSHLGDEGIRQLAQLDGLEVLSLVGTEISDVALGYISEMPGIRRLDLTNTAITDAGVARLSSVTSLEDLTLDRTAVTDVGVRYLANLKNLRRLSVNFSLVTNEGAGPLRTIESLRTFHAWHTAMSPETEMRIGHATGAEKYGIVSKPRVGILLTEFSGAHKHSMPYEYTQRHVIGIAQILIDLGYDLYAVVDPGTTTEGYMPSVIEWLGVEDRIVDDTDSGALSQLDVIVSGHSPMLQDAVIEAILAAVKEGTGFVNTSVFGNRVPGNTAALAELTGIDNPSYSFEFRYLTCSVLEEHPILAGLMRGDVFTIKWRNGCQGSVRGTRLLGPPDGASPSFCPLYVHEVGNGRVVNVQWQQITVTNGTIQPFEFYGRSVNYAAGLPVDATW